LAGDAALQAELGMEMLQPGTAQSSSASGKKAREGIYFFLSFNFCHFLGASKAKWQLNRKF